MAVSEIDRLRASCIEQNEAVCQTLGKALGFPWYENDQANFPGATEADGVCVGEHVPESLAALAAREIDRLRGRVAELEVTERRTDSWGIIDL